MLVHGAAGGVGSVAVQLAAARGARVFATVNGDDADYVKSFGADVVVDDRTTPFETVATNVDAVIDTIGSAVQQRSFHVLKRGGKLVSSVSVPDKALADAAGVDATWLLVDVTTSALASVAALMTTPTCASWLERRSRWPKLAKRMKCWPERSRYLAARSSCAQLHPSDNHAPGWAARRHGG